MRPSFHFCLTDKAEASIVQRGKKKSRLNFHEDVISIH